MEKKKQIVAVIVLVGICCGVMTVVDGIIKPDYVVKSAIKIIVFLVCPVIYSIFDPNLELKSIFKWDKKGMKMTLVLAISVYFVIMGTYFIARNFFDFSQITGLLATNAGVTGERFVWIALYISLVNSLLEEFFFRGFAFLTIKRLTSRSFAYLYSAFAFALYHVAMMQGWFSPVLFLLAMAGLAVGGAIFNYLNEKNGTIYNSWMVHMFANFAINTVGFMLFDMI